MWSMSCRIYRKHSIVEVCLSRQLVWESRPEHSLGGQIARRRAIHQPEQMSIGRPHVLRGQVGAAVLQHLLKNGRLVRSAGQKDDTGSLVEHRESNSDAVSIELLHPVGH